MTNISAIIWMIIKTNQLQSTKDSKIFSRMLKPQVSNTKSIQIKLTKQTQIKSPKNPINKKISYFSSY